MYYTFARQFGYTPQQIRDLTPAEFAMLSWGIDEENKAQEAAQSGKQPKHNPKGGSSANGEKVSSVSQLAAMMNG